MSTQVDLDQGGISRQWTQRYLGPSLGWVSAPELNIFPITSAGTYILDPSTNYVPVNVAGAVTLILPSAVDPALPSAQFGLFTNPPVVIVDAGGNAAANPITIQRNNAAETIMGLPSIQITVNYGGFTLAPNSSQKTWNSISP